MQITSGSNRFTFIIAIIYTVLLVASLYVKVANVAINPNEYIANLLLAALYVLLLIYLIRILVAVKEPPYIVAAFVAYAGLSAIQIMISALKIKQLYNSGTVTLATISMIIIIYLVFQAFRIKSNFIKTSFRLFAMSLALSIVLRLLLTAMLLNFALPDISNYMSLITLITPITLLLILRETDKMLKASNGTIGEVS